MSNTRPLAEGMNALDREDEALGIVESLTGGAPIARDHYLQVRLLTARCKTCGAKLCDEEMEWHEQERERQNYTRPRCFICLDDLAALQAYEAIYEPINEAVSLM